MLELMPHAKPDLKLYADDALTAHHGADLRRLVVFPPQYCPGDSGACLAV